MTDEDLDRYRRFPDSDYRDNEDDGEYVELPAWAIKAMIAATLVVLCIIGVIWRMVQ